MDALSPLVRRAFAFAGRAAAAAADLSCTAARRDSRAHRDARPSEGARTRAVDYWASLHARYERWIAKFRHCPVLSLDVRDYDLVADPSAIEDIAARFARARGRVAADGAVAGRSEEARTGLGWSAWHIAKKLAADVHGLITNLHGNLHHQSSLNSCVSVILPSPVFRCNPRLLFLCSYENHI